MSTQDVQLFSESLLLTAYSSPSRISFLCPIARGRNVLSKGKKLVTAEDCGSSPLVALLILS